MSKLHRRAVLGLGAGLAAGASATTATGQETGSAADLASLGRTPHTRYAINIEMWFRDLTFLERIARTAAWGFPAFEFWPWRNKDLDAIEALVKDTGLEPAQFTAWGFAPGMNDPANHAKFVEEIRASCATAKKIGAKKMTVVAGNDQPGMTNDEMLRHVTTALKLAAPIAEDANVMLILEPMNGRVDHPGHCLYGSAPAIRICQEVDSPMVKINWDLYHMQISEGDLCGHLREGVEQLGYVQLADHPGRHEPGTGEIHYPRVLKEVWDLGYRGFVGTECRPRDGDLMAARRLVAADTW